MWNAVQNWAPCTTFKCILSCDTVPLGGIPYKAWLACVELREDQWWKNQFGNSQKLCRAICVLDKKSRLLIQTEG